MLAVGEFKSAKLSVAIELLECATARVRAKDVREIFPTNLALGGYLPDVLDKRSDPDPLFRTD